MLIRFGAIAAMVFLAACGPSVAASFYTLETEHLRLIYYGQRQAYLVPHVARCFENSLRCHRRLLGYRPSERVTVLLHDLFDISNAGASAAPFNNVTLAIAPPSYAFETAPANERINATLNHELVHVAVNDGAAGTDRFFRKVFFGKVRETAQQPVSILYGYLTSPRRSSPRWYQEGVAVFLDTWMAGGLGRALGSYDEMVFRTAVRDSTRLYDRVGLESEGTETSFQERANSYLYGTRFMSYLALQYGPESVLRWAARSSGDRAYFASQFTNVFGISLDDEWSRWIAWERSFQQVNLEAIRQHPTTRCRSLSQRALGSVSRGVYDRDSRTLYVAVNYPGQVAYIAAINVDDGTVGRVCEVKGPALYFVSSLAYDSVSNTLFYTTDNNEWRDLRAVDVRTGRSRTLIKDARLGDLAFNDADRSLWGVRHFNGIATLVRIPPPYTEWHQVVSWPYGRNIYGLDISPDGRELTAGLSYVNGRQTLILMDMRTLQARDTLHQVLFDFGNSIPANFTWTADGRWLLGTSYHTGVSNVFRYDFSRAVMEAISNCETGLFNPIPVTEDSLIVFRYTGEGFVPVIIANEVVENVSAISFLGQRVVEKHPVVKTWVGGSPGEVGLDTALTYSGRYSGLKNIRLASAYPIVEGYGDWPAYGMRLDLADPVRLHRLGVAASYTPNQGLPGNERLHLDMSYSRLHWQVRFRHHDADFYDLFGPTKTSRKGHSFGIRWRDELLRDGPRIMDCTVDLTEYWGLEKLPEYQNITISYDRFLSLSGGVSYSHLRSSIGAVDSEKGHQWWVASSNRYLRGKLFSRLNAAFDYGLALPLHHSSVWLRSAAGYSPNPRREPLANSYFGGFGNNWVDHGEVRRYRLYYSFPGVQLNELRGLTYTRLQFEWTLPPLRFRRLGIPMLYATWARTALFTTGLVTDVGDGDHRRWHGNVGAQIDVRLMLMSHLRMTFSAGYAVAFRQNGSESTELMFSLKIL